MRTGAFILGLIGAAFGLLVGALAFLFGLAAFAFGGSGSAAGRSLLAVLFALASVVGAFVSIPRPMLGAVLLASAAVGSVLALGLFGAPMLFFMGMAAWFAFRGRKEIG